MIRNRPTLMGKRPSSNLVSVAAPFAPSDIPNLALWLDASDPATITQTGGSVSQWSDKSGLGNNATQATGANQPITGTRTVNGRNALDFNGTTSTMALPSAVYGWTNGPTTSFTVCARDTTANMRPYYGANGPSTRYGFKWEGGTSFVNGANGSDVIKSYVYNNNPQILVGRRSGTKQEIAIDGGVISFNVGATNGTLTQLNISGGSGPIWDGTISEVITYSRALTDAEINLVGQYLATKWGVVWTIAAIEDRTAFFGDSITAGAYATTPSQRWANIVAATYPGTTLMNQGLFSSVLQNTVPNAQGQPTGRARYNTAILGNNQATRVYILYGVNDIFATPSLPALNVTAYQTDLDFIIADLIANGYAKANIIIGSPPYFITNGNPPLQVQYTAAARAVAVAYQVKYADVYNYMINNGGNTLLDPDGVHPNDLGHAAIATAMLGAGYVS